MGSFFTDFLVQGVGCHHAGMALEDRSFIADLFRCGYLPILVATSTLGEKILTFFESSNLKLIKCYKIKKKSALQLDVLHGINVSSSQVNIDCYKNYIWCLSLCMFVIESSILKLLN